MSTKYRNSRDVPLDIIITRLNELSDAVTGGRESLSREFTMRVPAECDRDADLIIGEAASRLAKLQAECEKLRCIISDLKDWDCDVSAGFLSIPVYLRRRMQEAIDAARQEPSHD